MILLLLLFDYLQTYGKYLWNTLKTANIHRFGIGTFSSACQRHTATLAKLENCLRKN